MKRWLVSVQFKSIKEIQNPLGEGVDFCFLSK